MKSKILLILSFLLTFCATTFTPLPNRKDIESKTLSSRVLTPVNKTATVKKIETFENALRARGKNLTTSDWKLHDELLDTYIQLKANSAVKVPAHGRLKVSLPSFCLNHDRAIPSKGEAFKWTKGKPNIPYYDEIRSLVAKNELGKGDAQTLIWNLGSKVHWENYPSKIQALLKKIDPAAPYKLPSNLKDDAKDKALDFLKSQLPILGDADELVSTAKDKFRRHEDFAWLLDDLKSKYPLPQNDTLASIPESPLYSDVDPNGYSNQDVTLYNPTDKDEELDLSEYQLEPIRKDVQSIGFAPSLNDPLLSRLEEALFGSMARLGVGFTPILGDVADIYELATGKDFLTGHDLSWPERLLSGVGVVAGSGAGYRYLARAANAPERFIPKFEREFAQVAEKELTLGAREVKETTKLLEETKATKKAIEASPTLKNAFHDPHFKKSDFYVRPNGEVIPAKAYRYAPGDSTYLKELSETGVIPANPKGTYLTFKDYESAESAARGVQVPHDASIKIEFDTKQVLEDVKIPNGEWGQADYLEPITTSLPQHGPGGATQAITSQRIQATRITDLKTGRILYGTK